MTMDENESLEIHTEDAGDGFQRLLVHGELEISTADQLREAVAQVMREGHVNLIVDLNGVRYLDSSGLAVLLGTLRRVREQQGSLRLVCSVKPVLRVLALTGIDRLLPVEKGEAESPVP